MQISYLVRCPQLQVSLPNKHYAFSLGRLPVLSMLKSKRFLLLTFKCTNLHHIFLISNSSICIGSSNTFQQSLARWLQQELLQGLAPQAMHLNLCNPLLKVLLVMIFSLTMGQFNSSTSSFPKQNIHTSSQ